MRFTTLDRSIAIIATCLALSSSVFAQTGCPQADAYEPNNDCNNSATVMVNWQWYASLTVTGPQSPLGVDPDFFAITVPPYSSIAVECWFTDANGDIDVWLWDAASGNCPSHVQGDYLANGYSTTNNEFFSWDNTTGTAVDCIIGVQYFNLLFNCNEYDLRAGVTPLLACPGPDRFEPNDTCATSTPLMEGATNALSITGDNNSATPDPDYYHYTLGHNETLIVDVLFSHANGDIDCRLTRDPTCSLFADDGQSVTNNETVTYTNTTGAPLHMSLRVYGYNIIAPDPHCADYTLVTTVTRVPCASAVDDLFAPNQSCATAAPMVDGSTDSLFVSKTSSDYFEVLLNAGDHLDVSIYFEDVLSDVDLALYDPAAPGCGTGSFLILSAGTSDSEHVGYTNSSGAPKLFVIQVYVWPNLANPDCNSYHMDIVTTPPVVGYDVCFGDGSSIPCPCGNNSAPLNFEGCKNSTGRGARMFGSGSTSVGNDNLVMNVSEARPSMPGIFVQGDFMGGIPLKDGVFCLSSPTVRLGVVFTDANGDCASNFSVVTAGSVLPGQTRYYQYWYRDSGGVSPCGTGSNFSSGLRVDFTP